MIFIVGEAHDKETNENIRYGTVITSIKLTLMYYFQNDIYSQ